MLADVGDPQRPRVVDQEAEDPAAAREVADRAVGRLVDAAGEELGELAAVLVEDPERRVARAGQVARGLEDTVEDDVEVELGEQAASDLDEADEAGLVAGRVEQSR